MSSKCNGLTGVFWGAFDPLTAAHEAIILSSLTNIPLKRLVVVVNNHPYKTYAYSLDERLKVLQEFIQKHKLLHVELCSQDDVHKLDFTALRKMADGPLCAIAGYDSYKKWVKYSSPDERALYGAIAVVPRGDDPPLLFDAAAFLLPIDPIHKHVSSTIHRKK